MNNKFYLYFILAIFSCKKTDLNKTFESVAFCNNTWMVKNLDVSQFQNGDEIFEARTKIEWIDAFQNRIPAWCYYNNDPKNGKRYGKIYNWYAVIDERKLAPHGWQIASDEDWTSLTNCFGGQMNFIDKIDSVLFNRSINLNKFINLGGTRAGHGDFYKLNEYGLYFTNSDYPKINYLAWRRSLSIHDKHLLSFLVHKEDGMYVKCVKEK